MHQSKECLSKYIYVVDFLVLRSGLMPGVVLRVAPSGFLRGEAGVLVTLIGGEPDLVPRDGEE